MNKTKTKITFELNSLNDGWTDDGSIFDIALELLSPLSSNPESLLETIIEKDDQIRWDREQESDQKFYDSHGYYPKSKKQNQFKNSFEIEGLKIVTEIVPTIHSSEKMRKKYTITKK